MPVFLIIGGENKCTKERYRRLLALLLVRVLLAHRKISCTDEYGFDLPVDARIQASAFQQQIVEVYLVRDAAEEETNFPDGVLTCSLP